MRRFGLNFDPPSLVLEYERPDSGRLFHRRIGLRRLGPGADPVRTAEKVRRQNKSLLAEDQVPFEQLVSVITRLQSKAVADKVASVASPAVATTATLALSPKAAAPEVAAVAPEAAAAASAVASAAEGAQVEASPAADEDDLPEIKSDMDLNKLSTEELDRYKAKMDIEYTKNQKKPGDPGFVYDVQVDHEVGSDASSCGWDESGDEDQDV